jgi:hypothetical protein
MRACMSVKTMCKADLESEFEFVYTPRSTVQRTCDVRRQFEVREGIRADLNELIIQGLMDGIKTMSSIMS